MHSSILTTLVHFLLISACSSQFFPQNPRFSRQQTVGIAPLRADQGTEVVIPLSSRFMMRHRKFSPVTTTFSPRAPPAAQPTFNSIQPYQVLSHVDTFPEDEDTWQEGLLELDTKLAARLAWKAFEEDINDRIEAEMMWVPIKLLSGEGQIVSGVQYDLRVLAGTSNCSRYEINMHTLQESNCVHFNGPDRAIFNIIVSEKSSVWKPFVPDSSRIFSTLERKIDDSDNF